jgi:hypothetical protein
VPRIRTIKPEFFCHEELFDLEQETGLPLRLAFAGLWTVCDREGRFKWRPRSIKAHVLPFDTVDFSRVLDALTTRGFVEKYTVDGVEYGCVPAFSRHQVINNRESESELPEPPKNQQNTSDSRVDDACPTRAPRVPHAGKAEGKGKEGKGREGEGKGKEVSLPPKAEVEKPSDVDQQTWDDWKATRAAKRAGPITDTAMKLIRGECEAAGITLQQAVAMAAGSGWITFKAEYIKAKANQPRAPVTFAQQRELNSRTAKEEAIEDMRRLIENAS